MSSDRGAASATDMALDLKGLLKSIGRSMSWLLPLVVVVAVSVCVMLLLSPKKYRGTARVLIESTDYGLPGRARGAEEERAMLDMQGVASQVQLLMSADLAQRVSERLELAAIPEFKAAGSGGVFNGILSMVGLGSEAQVDTQEERVLKSYFKKLNVYRVEGSRVITVEFSAENAKLSAKVANTILDEYLALQSAAKRQSTEVATLSLQPQIVELRKDVQMARQAVADFRSNADLLLGTGDQTLSQQRLVELGTSYNSALAARDEAQAKASQVRGLLTSGGALETATDVLNSQLIQRLRERQAELQANVSEQSITLLPNHPQLKALKSQLADYDRLIRGEARKILAGLESDARVAEQQAETLGARLDELKQKVTRSNADQVRLDELSREAAAKERQLDILVSSYREADSRLKSQVLPADARIISRATVPLEPYAPKIVASTILAAVATFVFGCAIVIAGAFLSGNALYVVETRHTQTVPTQTQSTQAPEGYAEAFAPSAAGYAYSGLTPQPTVVIPQDERLEDDLDEAEVGVIEAELGDSAKEDLDLAIREETHWTLGESVDETVPDADTDPLVLLSEDTVEDDNGTDVPAETLAVYDDVEAELSDLGYDLRAGLDESHDALSDFVAEIEEAAEADETSPEQTLVSVAELAGVAAGAGAADIADWEADEGSRQEALIGDLQGLIVVLSVDSPGLSHRCAFHLARCAADQGQTSLMLEVFPEQNVPQAAKGFADLVAGETSFAKVIYGDANSSAHIIEAGSQGVTDELARGPRFAQTLEVISGMYKTVVIDLGAIDGSLASVQVLRQAQRVLLMTEDEDLGPELEGAAKLLRRNSRAHVEVFVEGDLPEAVGRGAHHAA